ncbi:signal transduction histidine kinase [Bradyrhizobium sp. LB8.2]|uniref:sensor histidine kinase n=1 Tax=unclassified Bradyrhizobium TaxID=2631580 RepID=UPI0033973484
MIVMEPVVGEVSAADEADRQIGRVDSASLRACEGQPESERTTNAFLRIFRSRLRSWWIRRSLFGQFALLSSLVLSLSVAAVGGWVGNRIAEGVLRGTSGAAALYMTNFVEPYVQSMDGGGAPSAEDLRGLDAVAELLKARRHVASIKIWGRDGTIVFSTQKSLIGRRFPTTDLAPSLQGQIRAGMADLEDDDSEFERSLSMPLYEIFLPLYKNETERIIAVAEIYEDAGALLRDQASAVRGAWSVVGSAGLVTLLALFIVVHQGSTTIKRQRTAIKQRFREKVLLHRKNDILKSEREDALCTAVHIDDLVHTRLGAELHDGPAQLISFALLRIEGLEQELDGRTPKARALLTEFRSALQDALKELRAIAADLLLPDLGDDGNLTEMLRKIIAAHEGRAACVVDFQTTGVPKKLPRDAVRCVVRVTQEALNNAYKHSGSDRQTVMVSYGAGKLRLSVRDLGCGFPRIAVKPPSGLGMTGMASRVRALGGTFSVISAPGQGAEISCELFVPSSTAGTSDEHSKDSQPIKSG